MAQPPPADAPTGSPDPSLRLDSEIPNTSIPNIAFDDYRLGPGDGIFVGVQRFPDLSFPATLDIQGNVVMPLAGTLNLTGLTLEETRETIFNLYNQYVVNPDVSVILTTQRPVEVTVVGEVPRPGLYPLQAPQLSVALLTAGGSTTLADLRLVQVDRPLETGEIISRTIDLFTPLLQGEPIPQVRLQDGDVITVPRLTPEAVESYDRALVATSTLARPEITIRVLNRAAGGRGGEARFGSINLRNGSRFLDALAVAGVNPDVAAYNRIAVLRFNPETGSADTIMVDATAAVNGDLTQNIPLQENDILVVDRNLLARVSYALNTFTQPFRDVLGFLLFFDSLTDSADSLFRP
ncbi:MAG: polysaccharide export protein [Tildeniella torsiva UHER 1998/13D]|nr:polysaccharide export protein [Tildeniella torsiva UHER 1998/13D]